MNIGIINTFYFYAYTGEKCGSVIIRYVLRETVDSMRLERAVGEVLRRFPFLRLTPAVSPEGDISFAENGEPCKVYPLDQKQRKLGTPETNGYMFAVRAGENVMEITAFHGFGDVRAINAFTSAVLLRYLGLPGAAEEDSAAAEEDVLQTLYEACSRFRGTLSADRYTKRNVFVLPMQTPLTGTPEFHVFRLKYPLEPFLSQARSMRGSPASFLSVLIAESIHSLYDTGEDIVTASVPVDLRPILHSRAQSNFTVNADLPFRKEELALPFEERVRRQKEFLSGQIRRDNLVSAVIAYGDLIRDVMKVPLSDRKTVEMLQRKTIEVARKQKTYLLTNVGPLTFPEDAMDRLLDVCVTLPLIEDAPIACVTAFGKTGCINWIQNSDDDSLIRRIQGGFRDRGIDAVLLDEGRARSDTVEPYLYVREGSGTDQVL